VGSDFGRMHLYQAKNIEGERRKAYKPNFTLGMLLALVFGLLQQLVKMS